MKNFIAHGDTITVPAPTGGILSGGYYSSGVIGGVATTTAAVGVPVAIKRTGIFEFPKVSAQAWAIGDKIYWDGPNGVMTNVAASLPLAGAATEVAANPSSVGRVSLKGFYPGP